MVKFTAKYQIYNSNICYSKEKVVDFLKQNFCLIFASL